MNTLALVLLLTVGTAEQSLGPYARPERGGTHSVATANGTVLLAWSENDAAGRARIHVVLLDASGRAISPISVLPALNPARNAIVPAIGTNGDSFLVVWEEVFGIQQTVSVIIDANGLPAGEPRPLSTEAAATSNSYQPARVNWAGGAYAVLTGRNVPLWVDSAGTVIDLIRGPVPHAVAADGTFGRAFTGVTPVLLGRFPGGPSILYPTVFWSVGGQTAGSEVMPVGTALGTPHITAADTRFVVTWTTPGVLHYRLTTDTLRGVATDVDEFANPRADCAQTHCVIAWATRDGDIEGLIFDHTQPQQPAERFTASAGERIEREAEVVMITNSRALVTWRSSGADGERLAGRTVQIGTPKRRSAQ